MGTSTTTSADQASEKAERKRPGGNVIGNNNSNVLPQQRSDQRSISVQFLLGVASNTQADTEAEGCCVPRGDKCRRICCVQRGDSDPMDRRVNRLAQERVARCGGYKAGESARGNQLLATAMQRQFCASKPYQPNDSHPMVILFFT
jgi:hypothetical protein